MIPFVIKNIWRKRVVAILSSTGIAFGLMLMFVLGAFNDGISQQINENFYRSLGIVEITEVEQFGANSRLPLGIPEKLFNSEIGDEILSYNMQAQLQSEFTAIYRMNGSLRNERDSLAIIGVNSSIDQAWEGPTSKIRPDGTVFRPGSYEAILDSRMVDEAAFFGINLDIGDNITLFLDYPQTKTGRNVNLTIVGIYDQSDLGAPTFVAREYYIYIDIQTAWNLQEMGWREEFNYTRAYSKIELRFPAVSNSETEKYISAIQDISSISTPLDVYSLAEFDQSIGDSLATIRIFTQIISIISGLAGGVAIIVAQLNSVSQRIKEFAILKATGWKNRHIFQSVILESLVLGLIGSIFGFIFGFLLVKFFSSNVSPLGSITAIVTIRLVITDLLYVLIVGVLGGVYPGIKAAKIKPIKVFQNE